MARNSTAYQGPRYPDPKSTEGLRQRLAERRRLFLPLYRPAQIKDVKR